ncbi:MAG: endolytic transglycosylase MltG [bacterium]
MKKIFIIFLFFLFSFLFFWSGIYLPKNFSAKEQIIFKIEKGWGVREIALDLEKAGLIRWGSLFRIYALSSGVAKNLQAGSYYLSQSMNIPKIVDKFVEGDAASFTITIPEGFTQKQIEDKLGMKLPGENLEGYLFPDTYQFFLGIDEQEVVEIMKDNFDKKTAVLKINQDIITMASILEKEVRTKEDKELVSGILWNRLKIGMPLQVDVALETYQKRGLPELPICNPGLESIKAAIYPKESPYWYYLSAPEGQTIFSKTLQEHNLAKAKYLK